MYAPYIISYAARTLLYVDANDGNDANNGTSLATAKLTIQSAITAGATEIIIRNDHANLKKIAGYVSLSNDSVQREVRIIGYYNSSGKYSVPVICYGTLYNAAQFTKTNGYSIVYESACAENTAASVFAVNPEYLTIAAGAGGSLNLTSRASIALVDANPGSYYLDAAGDKLYVSLPDSSTTYFSSGGDIVLQGYARSVEVWYGGIVHLENVLVWGGIYASDGGRIFMQNIEQRFSNVNGITINRGGTLFGNMIDVAYNYNDGINVHGQGHANLNNVVVAHVGTTTVDQCLTAHENASMEISNVVAYDASGSICAFVGASNLVMDNFLVEAPNNSRYGMEWEGEGRGLIQNGIVRNTYKGLWVANTLGGWRKDSRIKLKNVTFLASTQYDIGVQYGGVATVILENCRYTTVDPVNNNFTAVSSSIPGTTEARVAEIHAKLPAKTYLAGTNNGDGDVLAAVSIENTTIAVAATNTTFTLSAGTMSADAYLWHLISLIDASDGHTETRVIIAYTAGRVVTVNTPFTFIPAAGDVARISAIGYFRPPRHPLTDPL